MTFTPRTGQDDVLAATEPVVVVLGGAGTGKTTTAAAVVRRRLDDAHAARSGPRHALFLSFSRSAVSQILDRTTGILGHQAEYTDFMTFHGFAWHLIQQYGTAIGLDNPRLISPSEARLFGTSGGVTFDDLIPLALRLVRIPAIVAHLQRRWAIIVSDEFQDTSREQFELITSIRGSARLLLLGDLNQCIYTTLPGAVGVGLERINATLALPGARRIDLPEASHRDPTNILPAAASAIRQRNFNDDAVRVALDTGMLDVRHRASPTDEGPTVVAVIGELRGSGYQTVGIFSHHIDSTAVLSDHLTAAGIAHELLGLPDAVVSALQTQFNMLQVTMGDGDSASVRRSLGVFVTSVERGQRAPDLAHMIVGHMQAPATLTTRLSELDLALANTDSVSTALGVIAAVPNQIGLTRGIHQWNTGHHLLRTILGPRRCQAAGITTADFATIQLRLETERVTQLTYADAAEPSDIQVMGLYQSKGREADATVVVLRANDFYGKEAEPMPNGSRLLNVVLTRARSKTIILTFGTSLPGLVAPLANLVGRGSGS